MVGRVLDRLVDRLAKAALDAGWRGRPAGSVSIRALDGEMAGLSVDLKDLGQDGAVIGGLDEADVILTDNAADGCGVRLSTMHTPLGTVAGLTSLSEDGGDRTCWQRLPCKVTVFGVRLHLSLPSSGFVGGVGVAAKGFAALSLILAGASIAVYAADGGRKDVVFLAAPDPVAATPRSEGIDDLQREITLAGLNDHLSVDSMPDGTLKVAGALPDALQSTWYDLHRKWDLRSNAPLLIGYVEHMPAMARMPPISLIRFGADPYLILAADGSRLRIGDTISGGWRIKSIGPDAIRLRRGADEMEISP